MNKMRKILSILSEENTVNVDFLSRELGFEWPYTLGYDRVNGSSGISGGK